MIKSIALKDLRNGEVLQFNTDILAIVNLNNPLVLKVQPEYNNLLVVNQVIEGLFKTDSSNPITEELQALDARRDAAINGMIAVINGYSYHFNAAINTHATHLKNHLNLFGAGIARDNYQSETTTLRTIINDWINKPELAVAVTALNLIDWKNELETANTSFASKWLTRTQELGAVSSDTIKAKRTDAANAYYTLRETLDAYNTINKGADPFGKTINELNALIDQYNVLLAGRKGGGTNVTPSVPTTPA